MLLLSKYIFVCFFQLCSLCCICLLYPPEIQEEGPETYVLSSRKERCPSKYDIIRVLLVSPFWHCTFSLKSSWDHIFFFFLQLINHSFALLPKNQLSQVIWSSANSHNTSPLLKVLYAKIVVLHMIHYIFIE